MAINTTDATLTWGTWAEYTISHMDFGITLVFWLVIVGCWRCATRKKNLHPCLQFYSLMYAGFAVLLLLNFNFTSQILYKTDFFDHDTIKNYSGSYGANRTIYEAWKKEADLTDFPILRCFSLSLPVWLFLTFCACLVHTLRFVKKMPREEGDKLWKRDSTIIIIALPFVYGFMSFWSVQHTWQITSDSMTLAHVYGSIEETVKFFMIAFEANFAVADAYEALALWCFAELTLYVLEEKGKIYEQKLEDDVEARTPDKTLFSSTKRALLKDTSQKLGKDWKMLKGFHDRISDSASHLAMGGVKWFCISCLCSAIFKVVPEQFYFFGSARDEIWFVSTYLPPKTKWYMNGFLMGMGTVASFSAVQSLLTIEFTFGHNHLAEFNTAKKFWSTKVLVSLVFLQQILLLFLAGWTETRKEMAFSSLLCFESFLISLGHFLAWDENEPWYNADYSVSRISVMSSSTSFGRPLLEDSRHEDSDDSTP